MKNIIKNNMTKVAGAFCSMLLLASCSDWSDHFDTAGMTSDGTVKIFNGDAVSFIKSNYSSMAQIYQESGVFDATSANGDYTFIVAENDIVDAAKVGIADVKKFAEYTVADCSVAPPTLADNYGVETRSKKSLWVYSNNSGESVVPFKIDDYNIKEIVKTNNGYVYVIDGMLSVRPSIYEYLMSLPDAQYSTIKDMVKQYEEKWFDREASRVTGTNQQGQTTYDSVFVNRNTYLDMYNNDGVETWNMRDEKYNSTLFIPTNTQIEEALQEAYDNVEKYLFHKATAKDTVKFKNWIVQACFTDKRKSDSEVAADGEMFESVGGYMRVDNKVTDVTTYKALDRAYWLPAKQPVDIDSKEYLSNGVAYKTTKLHIPNHIVIYRLKQLFSPLFNKMQNYGVVENYFWSQDNTIDIAGLDDCTTNGQGETEEQAGWPRYSYNYLTAEPTADALAQNGKVTMETKGAILIDEEKIQNVNLPAGEYALSLGFGKGHKYTVSVDFRGEFDEESQYVSVMNNVALPTTGVNFNYDRAGASGIPHYGNKSLCYPEYYDVEYQMSIEERAIKRAASYDTDGCYVGTVKLSQDGSFVLRFSSPDITSLYNAIYDQGGSLDRTNGNHYQLSMFHWCLRPTKNNY